MDTYYYDTIKRAAGDGYVELGKYLIAKKKENPKLYGALQPDVDSMCELMFAAEKGEVELLQYLHTNEGNVVPSGAIDPATYYFDVISIATGKGYLEVFKYLLAKKEENPKMYGAINPAADNNYAIRWAS